MRQVHWHPLIFYKVFRERAAPKRSLAFVFWAQIPFVSWRYLSLKTQGLISSLSTQTFAKLRQPDGHHEGTKLAAHTQALWAGEAELASGGW